jgi:hypothetical protein
MMSAVLIWLESWHVSCLFENGLGPDGNRDSLMMPVQERKVMAPAFGLMGAILFFRRVSCGDENDSIVKNISRLNV